MDINKTHREKASLELQKNATSFLEQILETTPNETTVMWPLTSHFKNHPSKMSKICDTTKEARTNS